MCAGPICKNHQANASYWAPTLAELMVDPLILTVMKADRVDPAALEASLRTLARKRAFPVETGA